MSSLSILSPLDPPVLKQSNQRKKAKPVVPVKARCSPDPCCNLQQPQNSQNNGKKKPGFSETRDRKNGARDNTRNQHPCMVPPRMQSKPIESRGAPHGSCYPLSKTCADVDPCLVVTPIYSETELLNRQLKEAVFGVLYQTQTPSPVPTQPVCPPKQAQSMSKPVQCNENKVGVILPSTQTACDQRPMVISQVPSNADAPVNAPQKLRESPSAPPGLSKLRHDDHTHKSTLIPSTPSNAGAPENLPQKVNETLPAPPGLSKPRQYNRTHTPTVIARAPENPQKLDETLPAPPGLSKPRRNDRTHAPTVIVRIPSNAGAPENSPQKLNETLLAPPGLSKPKRNDRARIPAKPVTGERLPNEEVKDPNFERYNAPVAASRVNSPLPAGSASYSVKLPVSKAAERVPQSPATTASSLSDDLFDNTSALRSDTTFTSIDSGVSNTSSKPFIQYERGVCRDWMRGQCRWNPCRYLHPPRPDQCDAQQKRSVSPSPKPLPHSSTASKTPTPMRAKQIDLVSRKYDPSIGKIEQPQKPEPLYTSTISDHIKVRFDRGFEVRDVVTGFESRWVHLGNVASNVTSAAVNKLLLPYTVDSVHIPESGGKSVTVKIQFVTPEDAIRAVTDLNGTEFAKRTITAKLAINNSIRGGTILSDTDVQLVWEGPTRVGYAGYDTLKEAKLAIDSLNGFPMDGMVVSARLYEGLPCVGVYNVMLNYLPAAMTEQSLREFAKSNAVMMERPNYSSLDKAVKSLRSKLEECGAVTSFDVLPPPYKHGMIKAWAHFTSPFEARVAQDDLDRRRPKPIGHTTLSCRRVVSVSHVFNATSYKKMREDIGWLRWSWQRRYGPGVSIREKVKESADDDHPVYIRISSDRPELLSALKYEFERLLHGETITFEKKPLWDDFLLAQAGRDYVAQMQTRYPGVQIQVQNKRRAISLWGPVVVRHRARQDIVRRIMELKAQQYWKIPLTGKLLGVFCSAELSTLQELLGPENCFLNYAERALIVRGNDSAFQTACRVVQDVQSRQGDDGVGTSGSTCPVCFDEAIVPISLECGHQWCRTCLTGYITSTVDNKMFPLRCLGDEATCTQCIPLGISRRLLSAAEFDAVIEAAFWVYVHSRPDEFFHCPTPDCTQVYRSAPPNAVLQCPSCLVRICPSCRIEYHDGMTCEERDVADDKLFNEWTSNNDVKSCPGCRAPIERSEGCNHMTCVRCLTHICWECMETFPKGEGIYDHMRNQHGGIGL